MRGSKNTKIAVDIDGVIIEIIPAVIKWIMRCTLERAKFHMSKITRYDIWNDEYMKSIYPKISEKLFYIALNSKDYADVYFVDGSRQMLKELNKKYDVFFLTSMRQNHYDSTLKFLKSHKITNKIVKVKSAIDKKDIEFYILLEDRVSTAIEVLKSGKFCIILTKEYNSREEYPSEFRISNVSEFRTKIEDIKAHERHYRNVSNKFIHTKDSP